MNLGSVAQMADAGHSRLITSDGVSRNAPSGEAVTSLSSCGFESRRSPFLTKGDTK